MKVLLNSLLLVDKVRSAQLIFKMVSGKNNLTSSMREVKLEKVVMSISCGGHGDERVRKAWNMLSTVSGQTPVLRKSKITINQFRIRRNEKIATDVTMRGPKARDILNRALRIKGLYGSATTWSRPPQL